MPFAESLETPGQSLMASMSLPGVSLNLVTNVQDSSPTGPVPLRGVAVHEWIPVGSLATRTQCRCCHCGVTRTYDLSSEPSVGYARYGETFVEGPMDATDAPECVAYGRRMPPVVGSRSWDILSWAQS
jgi:hypothetical protein